LHFSEAGLGISNLLVTAATFRWPFISAILNALIKDLLESGYLFCNLVNVAFSVDLPALAASSDVNEVVGGFE
jgi:hypothetical protein